MDNFVINYGEFSKDLTAFVDEVSKQFKTGAPDTLQYITAIPTFLTTSDPAVTSGDVHRVLQKFSVLADVTSHLFKYLPPCVQDEVYAKSQIRKLEWFMGLCKSSLAIALANPQKYNVTGMSAGVSSWNTGVQRETDNVNWEKLNALWNDIRNFSQQMSG